MWIPAHTTRPPRSVTASALGTSAPTGAKMIAASSGSGGDSSLEPAHSQPRSRAKPWPASSPQRGEGETRRPPGSAARPTSGAGAPADDPRAGTAGGRPGGRGAGGGVEEVAGAGKHDALFRGRQLGLSAV